MFSKKNHFSKLIQKSKNKNLKKLHNIDIFTQIPPKKLPSKIQIAYSSSRMCNTYRPINNIKIQLPDFLVYLFLAVHNSSIGDLVTHSLTHSLRVLLLLTLQSDPRDLWPLRHLIRVIRRHDLTVKNWQIQRQRQRQMHFKNTS